MRLTWRIAGGLRRLLPVALCALGGHFALYHSLRPATGDHAYFSWYEPLVGGLSLAGLVGFTALLLAVVIGREGLRRPVVRALLPATARPVPGAVRAVRLALASIAFLVCQETIERTLAEGRLSPAAFTSSQLLVMLGTIAALAALVALVERSCTQLIAHVIAPRPLPSSRPIGLSFPPERPLATRRRNALAELRGLRAPPVLG
jgi:hypothetical protein